MFSTKPKKVHYSSARKGGHGASCDSRDSALGSSTASDRASLGTCTPPEESLFHLPETDNNNTLNEALDAAHERISRLEDNYNDLKDQLKDSHRENRLLKQEKNDAHKELDRLFDELATERRNNERREHSQASSATSRDSSVFDTSNERRATRRLSTSQSSRPPLVPQAPRNLAPNPFTPFKERSGPSYGPILVSYTSSTPSTAFYAPPSIPYTAASSISYTAGQVLPRLKKSITGPSKEYDQLSDGKNHYYPIGDRAPEQTARPIETLKDITTSDLIQHTQKLVPTKLTPKEITRGVGLSEDIEATWRINDKVRKLVSSKGVQTDSIKFLEPDLTSTGVQTDLIKVPEPNLAFASVQTEATTTTRVGTSADFPDQVTESSAAKNSLTIIRAPNDQNRPVSEYLGTGQQYLSNNNGEIWTQKGKTRTTHQTFDKLEDKLGGFLYEDSNLQSLYFQAYYKNVSLGEFESSLRQLLNKLGSNLREEASTVQEEEFVDLINTAFCVWVAFSICDKVWRDGKLFPREIGQGSESGLDALGEDLEKFVLGSKAFSVFKRDLEKSTPPRMRLDHTQTVSPYLRNVYRTTKEKFQRYWISQLSVILPARESKVPEGQVRVKWTCVGSEISNQGQC